MIPIVLISHGHFAKEALRTAEMIIGLPQEEVYVISVTEGRSYEECLVELQTLSGKLQEKADHILLLTDIYGGTPANIATYLTLTSEKVQVYSGFNLPVLLELLLARPATIEATCKCIEETYQVGLANITEKSKEVMEDGDRMDTY